MAVPWARVIDSVIGVTDVVVRQVKGRMDADPESLPAEARGTGTLEARLAGVVVAALKEAFDRDHQRLELEKGQIEAERQRAERALKLELFRQAGDREVGRLRLLAGAALASWLGTLLFAARLADGAVAGRMSLAIGWLLLLAALAASLSAHTRIVRTLGAIDQRSDLPRELSSAAGDVAPWLIVIGLAVIGFGMLFS
jgi:hypothetical protein